MNIISIFASIIGSCFILPIFLPISLLIYRFSSFTGTIYKYIPALICFSVQTIVFILGVVSAAKGSGEKAMINYWPLILISSSVGFILFIISYIMDYRTKFY